MARIGDHRSGRVARAALVEAVSLGGPDLAAALEELCAEEGAETGRWVRVLLEVDGLGVAADLVDGDRRDGVQGRLCVGTGLSADSVRWAVEAWSEALGVEPPAEVPFTPPPPIARRVSPAGDGTQGGPEVPALRPDGADVLEGGGNPVVAVALSADGAHVATAGTDHVVRLQRLGAPAAAQPVAAHDGSVTAVAFSSDGDLVASGSEDGCVHIADVATGRALGLLTAHEAGVTALAFESGGDGKLATGGSSGAITLWDPRALSPLRKMTGHDAAVSVLAFRSGGRVVASGGADDALRMWLAAWGTAGHVLRRRGPVTALAMDPDGAHLAVALRRGLSVRRFNWPANINPIYASLGQMLRGDVFFQTGAPRAYDCIGVNRLTFSSDGRFLAAGTTGGTVHLWRVEDGRALGHAQAHEGPVLAVNFETGGARLATAGADGAVRWWRWTPRPH